MCSNNQPCKYFFSQWVKVATSFYRLCCKEIVKEDVNTDYDTYGQEGDVDYVTNQNPYYEHDYDDMETAGVRPHARVRASKTF